MDLFTEESRTVDEIYEEASDWMKSKILMVINSFKDLIIGGLFIAFIVLFSYLTGRITTFEEFYQGVFKLTVVVVVVIIFMRTPCGYWVVIKLIKGFFKCFYKKMMVRTSRVQNRYPNIPRYDLIPQTQIQQDPITEAIV